MIKVQNNYKSDQSTLVLCKRMNSEKVKESENLTTPFKLTKNISN